MKLKLIMVLVSDEHTDEILHAARDAGATGASVITSARGEGLKQAKTFLGLDLTTHRDVLLFLVAAAKAREILEKIAEVGKFDEEAGSGVAFQINIEDAVGLTTQLPTLLHEVEEEL